MLAEDMYSTDIGRGVLPMPAELYLHAFRRGLLALPESERVAIVDEVREQIAGQAALGEAGLQKLLTRLGPPEQLARQFTFSFELADSVNRSNPFRLLVVVLATATADLWALCGAFVAVVLYILSAAFALIALLKPVLPQFVGAWISESGDFTMGLQLAHRGREVLGYGIIPVSIGLAVGSFVAGNTLLRGCGRRLMRSARRWTGRGARV
jgi:hypothetical protein